MNIPFKIALTGIFAFVIFSCTRNVESVDEKANQIVVAAIEKNGGMDSWNNLIAIAYDKTTTLFDSTGKVESRILQRHQYTLTPVLKATITWVQGTDSVKITNDSGQAIRYINGIRDSIQSDDATSIIQSSLFVLFQPFKLVDEGVGLKYIGSEPLQIGSLNTTSEVVQPVYKGQRKEDDQWWFYFGEDSQFLANMVRHNGRYSFIENISFDTTQVLKLHSHRKSYFVDSSKNINYLRAEYFYTNYQLVFRD